MPIAQFFDLLSDDESFDGAFDVDENSDRSIGDAIEDAIEEQLMRLQEEGEMVEQLDDLQC